ncbi:MAG: chaperonin GroEL [Candidatus Colwellbacteria bacterium]|nr:chaperonin GroEL [Candidatus Colwellbacteria bacterium]
MAKQIIFDEEARRAMKAGIDKLAAAVRVTLGPRGRAVVIEKGFGAPQVTFDGVTVAKEVELEDKFENLGAEFLKQAADRTNDNVGDGTTTSVVLSHALIEEGENTIKEKGFNVIQLSEALKEQSVFVVENLESQKEVIAGDNKKVEEVATLSAKDSAVGKLIAEVMQKVGSDGVVTIEDSNTIGNSHEIVEGMQFDRGYISQYMVTNTDKMEAVLENPYILVTDTKISAIQDLLPLLEKIVASGKKELLIVAEDMDGEALTTLIVNKLRGIFTVIAVKAPGFGDRRKEMLADIAVVTGAEVISEELGRQLKTSDVTVLGQASKVIVTKDHTTIVNGKGSKADIDARVAAIKVQLEKSDSDYDKDKLKERMGKLSGGVAIIKVGAPTESAQKELKQRVEDAVAATRAAMEEGIVPGGGMALWNISKLLNAASGDKPAAAAAKGILSKALQSPLNSIIVNSGESISGVVSRIDKEAAGKKWFGFNALTNEICDLKEAGIIDPLKVTKTAFMNAISVAANYLTIGAAMTEIPKKEEPAGHDHGGMDY